MFQSRLGSELSQLIEFVVYDEIFIEGCYHFKTGPEY